MPGREWPESWEGAVPSVLQPARAPRSAHPPLSRSTWSFPLSPSPTLAPTNPFAFTFPTPNPLLVDPFGFAANASGTVNHGTPNNPFFQPSTTAKSEHLNQLTNHVNPRFQSSQPIGTHDIFPPQLPATVGKPDPFPPDQHTTASLQPGNSKVISVALVGFGWSCYLSQ